jgi:RNA polymerase sigma factor (sigma-70 family)
MATSPVTSFIHNLRKAVLHQDGGGLSDGQLLHCFLAGQDEAAFEALVQRHGPMVLGVCRRVLQNAHDAEDAFQATFLVFLRKAATIVPREFVGNWLYGVAYRTALKARSLSAKRRLKESQVRNMPQNSSLPPDVWHDVQPVLDQELSRLPDKYRVPVVLCDLEGKGRKEVARQLGWPEGTLSGRLARARRILARRLARYGLALSAGTLATVLTQNAATASVPVPLMTSTIKAAALTMGGNTLAAGVLPGKVVTIADGVMKTMFLARLKVGLLVLLAVGLIGLGTGMFAQRLLADKAGAAANQKGTSASQGKNNPRKGRKAAKLGQPAKNKDGNKLNGQPVQTYSGKIVEISKDGKLLTVKMSPTRKGEKAATVEIKLSPKTEIAYFGVGSEGAHLTRGYHAEVWLREGSTDTAARIHLKGKEGPKKPADLTARVAAISEDGKTLTVTVPPKKIKGKKRQEPTRKDIRLTDNTVVTFSNVGLDGAKARPDYVASIWLEKGSKDTAAAVAFNGAKEKKSKKATSGKLDPAPPSHGKIVAVAADGKGLTLEIIAPKKKKVEKGKPPEKLDVKIDGKTEMVFYQVGPGGARPAEGYLVQLWLREGSKDTAAKFRLTHAGAKKKVFGGKVAALAADGKSFTLELPRSKKKGGKVKQIEVKLTDKTNIVYNGVGPGEAKLTQGYYAKVIFQEKSPDSAEVVLLTKSTAK